jgi:hypothetical protein
VSLAGMGFESPRKVYLINLRFLSVESHKLFGKVDSTN